MYRSPLALGVVAVAAVAGTGCGSGGRPQTTGSTTPPKAHLVSSIAEGAQLDAPVRWEARLAGVAPSDVTTVRFLIDGRVRHVEHEAPYEFDGHGNRLLPGSLKPGSHTFAVDAELASGQRVTAAATATVSDHAVGIPGAVIGRWHRTVTAADVRRTIGFRRAEDGDPLPRGSWTVRIGADGIARYVDPTGRDDAMSAGQVRFEAGGRLVVGNEVPNIAKAEGYFCPDTVPSGRYRWSIKAGALVVRALEDRGCADRNSLWNGRFTR